MILKTGKLRSLAGLLCASLLLSSCGMIIDDDQSSLIGHSAPVSTSVQSSLQTSSAQTAAQTGSAEGGSSAEQTDTTLSASGQQTAGTSSAAGTTVSVSVSQTVTVSSSGSTVTTTAASKASSASSGSSATTAGSSGSSSKTTTVTTSAVTKSGKLTESDQAFLADCVFVGDSICSGLSVYKILSSSHVLAKGNVGVRSIFDYTFKVGSGSYKVVQGLNVLKPKNVIFWMGMNDINMTNSQKYCENYKNLLTKVQETLPSAKLYVASISPITTTSTFSTNKKIDSYNAVVRDYLAANYPSWGFVDFSPVLKNEWNALRSNYTSGDGIHLSPAAYQAMLAEVCRQLAP